MFRVLRPIYLAVIITLPAAVAILPLALAESRVGRIAGACIVPICFVLSFVVVVGVLSRPHRWAIQAGKFRRDESTPLYRGRRLYGLCWTAVYYFPPLYWLCLSAPQLKKLLFRLFGYRGSLDFTTYPDTWLRDLPLIEFGSQAYIANRATIGTNIILRDGELLVGPVKVGQNATVGHLSIIGVGAVVSDRAQVGLSVAFGLNARLGANGEIGPASAVDHGACIHEDVSVGSMSYVGRNVVIHKGIRIPAASLIPRNAEITTQEDVATLISSEAHDLNRLRAEMAAALAKRLVREP